MKLIHFEKAKLKSPMMMAFLGIAVGATLFLSSCTQDEVIDTIETIEEAIEETIEEEANLDNLTGNWIRIASNNPGSDGMIIEMSGTTGKLVDKAGSGFQVDDIKWNDIKAIDSENYSHQELGSDYNYYEATMLLKADDTLRISVGSSGAGNTQKWVREGEYTPEPDGQANTETLDCSISEARTLTNGSAEIDYIIDCVIDVTAPLIIEPGVVIQFNENAGLGVYDNGTLTAIGTAAEPIVFKGATSTSGLWRGIHIETRSISNTLEHVRIEDAGSNYVYCCNESSSLFLKGAKIGLKNIEIRNGNGIGLYAGVNSEFDSYENIRIETHAEYPVWAAPEVLTYLDGMASDYSNNDKDYIFVNDGNFGATTRIHKTNIPYLFEGKVYDVTAALTIEAGVEIVFQENGGLGVYDNGSLKISGNANDPVLMRGQDALKGFWRGIHIETNKIDNSLDYLHLSDAGSNYVYCCNGVASIFLKDGQTSITNSVISNGKAHGILATKNFEFSGYANNTITTHELAPLNLSLGRVGELDGRSSSYQGNNQEFILISDDGSTSELTIYPTDVPYLVDDSTVLDITERLNIEAGVEIVFSPNSGLGVYDNGILNAVGTANDPIIFRGFENSVGYWRGIHTETNSASNIIRHAEIRNAGSNYVYCCNDKAGLIVKAGQMTVENSVITQSGGCGILVKSSANFTGSGNDYSNNTDGGLCN